MILASAIKIWVDSTKESVILCGARHGDIFKQLDGLGLDGYREIEQGFIDHNNNFLTRTEAYYHAKECGQLAAKIIDDREHNNPFGTNLISEDLW